MAPRSPGLVVVAHGGCGFASVRHEQVVAVLHAYRLATLLVDLATEGEALDRACRGPTAVGLLGEGLAAAVVLKLAAEHPAQVAAVVAVEGEPERAGVQLAEVQAPTLLIVGANDSGMLERARETMRTLRCNKRLEVVPGTARLCDDAGALATVAHLSGAWFANHLPDGRRP